MNKQRLKFAIGAAYFVGGCLVIFKVITAQQASELLVLFLGAERFAAHSVPDAEQANPSVSAK